MKEILTEQEICPPFTVLTDKYASCVASVWGHYAIPMLGFFSNEAYSCAQGMPHEVCDPMACQVQLIFTFDVIVLHYGPSKIMTP